ncbi:MAG: hypothetical protein ACLQGV_00825 [Bryobacteraceae bacterium]
MKAGVVVSPGKAEDAQGGVGRLLRPATVLRFNALLGLCGLVAGAIAAGAGGARLVPPAPVPSSLARDYFGILAANESVLLYLALGLPVLGIYGNVVILFNWFRFGSDCVAIMRGSSLDVAYLLIHGPVELAVFTLGSAAVQGAALCAVASLVFRRKFEWRVWAWRYAMAAALLVPVAALEILSKWARAARLP